MVKGMGDLRGVLSQDVGEDKGIARAVPSDPWRKVLKICRFLVCELWSVTRKGGRLIVFQKLRGYEETVENDI